MMKYDREFPEWYKLTAKGKEDCLKMVNGANPSELGLSMTDAAVALWAFAHTMREGLKVDRNLEEDLKREIEAILNRSVELWKTYREAAGLTGELHY